jgi:long-subunit acyl-CoA synthetase (AMP-forming)
VRKAIHLKVSIYYRRIWFGHFVDCHVGEILIRGPSVTRGYYKRPDLNEDRSIFTEDGWFRTGDVGQWNPDGTLSIIDRVKNLVKLSGGEVCSLFFKS